MARRDPAGTMYEESPDEISALQLQEQQKVGTTPVSKPSRAILLQDHDWNIKRLAEGKVPPRSFILPAPYPPAAPPTPPAEKVYIDELQTAARRKNSFLYVRTITEPYVYSTTVTVIEDERGNTARLTVCNLDDSAHDPILFAGSILAIAQPCWSLVTGEGYHIRVNQPSDLVVLDPSSESVPKLWRCSVVNSETRDACALKRDGDAMFLKKKFRKALKLYSEALWLSELQTDLKLQVDLLRKRCGVNLVLLRIDDAAQDLSRAILTDAQATHSDSAMVKNEVTIICQSLYQKDSQSLPDWFHNLPRPLKELAARIRMDLGEYQRSAAYNFRGLLSRVGPLSLHLDAASYVGDTEIRDTKHHGRGLFASRSFKTGDLIIAEKAFALPGYIFNDRSSDCALYSIGDGTAADRAGALLFKELVQKLLHNPSQRKRFFDMDDGGYWQKHGWAVHDNQPEPVDVFRIEHIRRRNCFSVPLRSLDLLTAPSIVRNGVWIHASYMNHSCLPNSVRSFIGDMLFLRAARDIEQDEEITTQYLAPELEYETRQQKFETSWGFRCDCALCDYDRSVGQAEEKQRMEIFEELRITAMRLGDKPTTTALKKFTKRLRDLEALYDYTAYASLPRLCLVHPTIFLTEAWRTLKSVDKTIESARKLLSYFGITTQVEGEHFSVVTNLGLVNVEAVRALKYMAEGYKLQGMDSLAEEIGEVAKKWFRVITGSDVGMEDFMKA